MAFLAGEHSVLAASPRGTRSASSTRSASRTRSAATLGKTNSRVADAIYGRGSRHAVVVFLSTSTCYQLVSNREGAEHDMSELNLGTVAHLQLG